MSRIIGCAVVGLGIGQAHADGIAQSDGGRLVAVCDLLQEKLDKMAAKYPGI